MFENVFYISKCTSAWPHPLPHSVAVSLASHLLVNVGKGMRKLFCLNDWKLYIIIVYIKLFTELKLLRISCDRVKG